MKVLAFNPDLEKLNVLEKNYRPYQVLLFHHHHVVFRNYAFRCSKGIALETIANQLHIDLQDVMALGDNLNDVSMLERVGYPVAMDNAMPEVKAIAKLVTDTNEHSGVGKAIMKVLTEEK